MKDVVSFLLEHCSQSRVKKFLDRFGVEAESVELNSERIEWRSSIESLMPEVLGLLEETAEKIVMLASERISVRCSGRHLFAAMSFGTFVSCRKRPTSKEFSTFG